MTSAIRNALLCGTMAVAFAAPAYGFNVVVPFDGANGEDVFDAPIQAADGNIYGTTVYGGKSNYGVFYRLTPKGAYKVLYSFCAQAKCADGTYPGGLTQGADGNFYGQTYQGGASNAGTIFKLTATGQLTTLYSFCTQANCSDGALPQSSLVQTADGTFYATTVIGGANNQGTVFKFVPGTGLTTLYNFCPKAGCADGAQPNIGLTLASDGNFYGNTAWGGVGGSSCGYIGCGTVFRIAPTGAYKRTYAFCSQPNCADGQIPQGLMIEGKHGELYGTTDGGGTGSAGTVFKISLKGTLTTLHTFCAGGNCTDGLIPYAGLTLATDGNFYGTTNLGGPGGYGTVYKLSPVGVLTIVFGFDDGADGGFPDAGVLQAASGKFYGGTTEGGSQNCSSGCGVLFRTSAKANATFVDRNRAKEIAAAIRAGRPMPVSPLTLGAPARR